VEIILQGTVGDREEWDVNDMDKYAQQDLRYV
jgi:hypothetical protein